MRWEITVNILGMDKRYGYKRIRLVFLHYNLTISEEKFETRKGHSLL